MKCIGISLLLAGSLSLSGCHSQTPSLRPDWDAARRNLRIRPEDCQKAPVPENRGARANEVITEGDTISRQQAGWLYTWRLESVNGTNIVLRPVEAKRMK